MNEAEGKTAVVHADGKTSMFQVGTALWVIIGIVEALLVTRLVLKLAGANIAGQFTDVIYGFSGLLISPFTALVGTPAGEGSVFELAAFLAIIAYALLFVLIVWLIMVVRKTKAAHGPVLHADSTRERDKSNIQK